MQFDPKGPPPAPLATPQRRIPQMLVWAVALLFILGGLSVGAAAMPEAFGWAKAISPQNLTQVLLPFQNNSNTSTDGPDWSLGERVNILLMGVDRRPEEKMDDPVRTDTMMVVSIDPNTHTASMLGIPRDLWVPIPLPNNGVLHDRINTANVYGVMRNLPGGGAQLAKDTVSYNLGVKIHYFVMLDFQGFRNIIDTLGGIDVKVDKAVIDYEYPTDDYGYMTVNIPAGDQHLDGERALQYARSRHADSDFGRMKRQQQVILSAREKALRLDMLPKLPSLWGQFKDSIRTDMGLGDILAVAKAAKEVKSEDIVGRTLEFPYVTSFTGQDGAALLLPNRDTWREVVDETFTDARKKPNSRIEVLNGTGLPGLATQTANQLKQSGYSNVTVGDATGGPVKQTQVYTYGADSGYTANLVASLLKVGKDRVKAEKPSPATPTPGATPVAPVDIRIVLGQDFTN